MTRHLQDCSERANDFSLDTKKSGEYQNIYHLLVEDTWVGDYWLHLQSSAQATLDELDFYLRVIWLECCGHMSRFLLDEVYYVREPEIEWAPGEVRAMDVQIGSVLRPGMEAVYDYDFGSPTRLKISVKDELEGTWRGKPIHLMARNLSPDDRCQACEEQAKWICMDCPWEEDEWLYCQRHFAEHEHDAERALPLVNSPRTGVCGYEGPAMPPY